MRIKIDADGWIYKDDTPERPPTVPDEPHTYTRQHCHKEIRVCTTHCPHVSVVQIGEGGTIKFCNVQYDLDILIDERRQK